MSRDQAAAAAHALWASLTRAAVVIEAVTLDAVRRMPVPDPPPPPRREPPPPPPPPAPRVKKTRVINMDGQRFGRLVVAGRVTNMGPDAAWRCLCDCGEFWIVRGGDLRSGKTRSCGCLRREKAIENVTEWRASVEVTRAAG